MWVALRGRRAFLPPGPSCMPETTIGEGYTGGNIELQYISLDAESCVTGRWDERIFR